MTRKQKIDLDRHIERENNQECDNSTPPVPNAFEIKAREEAKGEIEGALRNGARLTKNILADLVNADRDLALLGEAICEYEKLEIANREWIDLVWKEGLESRLQVMNGLLMTIQGDLDDMRARL